MPDVVKKQTIKQAKASFKARGRPTLSEKESRQLQRSIELEKRAERAREAEKRRVEAAKKRANKEKREQQQGKQDLQLGTQRRRDRFGHKSSQFHLGAFFRKGTLKSGNIADREKSKPDVFGDQDLDDDDLLQALDSAAGPRTATRFEMQRRLPDASLMPPPPLPTGLKKFAGSTVSIDTSLEEFSDLFDDLDSSSQIARALDNTSKFSDVRNSAALPRPLSEVVTCRRDSQLPQEDLLDIFNDLESGTQIARELNGGAHSTRRSSNASGSSFGSSGMDLTLEDMERIDPPKVSVSPSLATTASWPRSGEDRLTNAELLGTAAMLPVKISDRIMRAKTDKHTEELNKEPDAKRGRSLTQPPPLLPKAFQGKAPPRPRCESTCTKQQMSAIRGPFLPASSLYCSPDLGFTSTQLEGFIDDDLQLTQVS